MMIVNRNTGANTFFSSFTTEELTDQSSVFVSLDLNYAEYNFLSNLITDGT